MTRNVGGALAALTILAGCATDPATVGHLARAHAEAAKVQTLTLECSGPCKASYIDPRDRPALAMPTNGWDAAKSITGSIERIVTGAVMPAAVAAVAITGIKGAGGNNSSVNTSTSTSSDSHDTVSTVSTATTTNTSTSSVVDDHSVNTTSTTDSHNTDSHAIDNTAPPVVVIQPPPVVVMP